MTKFNLIFKERIMKKYFMKGTNDEVQFGDVIQLDLTKNENGKLKHKHFECEFQPGIADYLVEEDVIEVKEFKEQPAKQGILHFEFDDMPKHGSDYDVDRKDYDEEEECPLNELFDSIQHLTKVSYDLAKVTLGMRKDLDQFIAGFGKKATKNAKSK